MLLRFCPANLTSWRVLHWLYVSLGCRCLYCDYVIIVGVLQSGSEYTMMKSLRRLAGKLHQRIDAVTNRLLLVIIITVIIKIMIVRKSDVYKHVKRLSST